ncbi:hypothetical protein OAI_11615 [Vibrio cyclitrophicus FF160]|uniref:tyrosine-type recombinase/integrase n=1 Tax=Vibrio cyclitrophicus TaxID=47951 RepID=UPI0002D54D05|nr:site-specific integrase [Vibrio cyclitrophicus]OEE81541.1 hypothetical protein OAI_11615 [Vibrio cyclitrophicus FF160]
MASAHIEKVKTKSGDRFKACIVFEKTDSSKRKKTTRTFKHTAQAETYLTKTLKKINSGDFSFIRQRTTYLAVREALEQFNELMVTSENLRYSKNMQTTLKRFSETSLADLPTDQLVPRDIFEAIIELKDRYSLAPSTLSSYLSDLSTAFSDTSTILGIPMNLDAIPCARKTLQRHSIVAPSVERTRTIKEDELTTILTYFSEMDTRGRAIIPMGKIIIFAILTCMRQGEICGKLQWGQYNKSTSVLTVVERKDPKSNQNKTTNIQLNEVASEIINSMPHGTESDPIFPFNPQSVSASWARAMKKLGIDDLHFHDLRAFGASRLFELGVDLFSLSKLAGHNSTEMLRKRYLRGIPVKLPPQEYISAHEIIEQYN